MTTNFFFLSRLNSNNSEFHKIKRKLKSLSMDFTHFYYNTQYPFQFNFFQALSELDNIIKLANKKNTSRFK